MVKEMLGGSGGLSKCTYNPVSDITPPVIPIITPDY